jgi:hypothetical protein
MERKCPKKVKSPILRQLWNIFAEGMQMIEEDKCNEAHAYSMLSRFNAESKGYVDNTSTVNYDEAMRNTGIKSRNQLNAICKAHGIEQVKINNQSVGFLRSEIEDLAQQIRNKNRNAGV